MRDCMILNEVIRTVEGSEASLDFYQKVIDEGRIQTSRKELTEDDVHNFLRRWLSENLLKASSTKKVITFVFVTEFDQTPLYINDKDLEVYVRWRFKIAK